ncbi:hypothetical protein EG327_009630 [Venturia inaequalis]|uniref:alpha-1,2-Mannosidase n=1 Tax=Venturia inaequalis TaxID=5025 RepID=A0A8H3VL48_VENIN|nr:hypothetical protein EG327_009630 [Venturia inaequalis]
MHWRTHPSRFATVIFSLALFHLKSAHGLCSNGTYRYPRACGKDYDYTGFTIDQNERAAGVIEQFRFAWDGYYKYAYPHDDLKPADNTFSDSRNGWGLTMVDALDTAIIMGQKDIVKIILDFIPTVNFTKNNSVGPIDTSLFETNIRYLGGLLAAYDLLKGPFNGTVTNTTQVDALLSQARTLADALKFCFNTPTGIPVNAVFLGNKTFLDYSKLDDGSYTAGLAELGTLQLEWQHLSDLTGDPSYGDLAQRAESWWFKGKEVWPGLTGGLFNVSSGAIIEDYGGWTAGNDSAYEYLIKMYVYDPDRYQNYSARWQLAADSTITHLLSSPPSRPDLVTVGTFSGSNATITKYSEFLACFIGGSFILGSTALKKPKYLDYGLKFAEWCANGYRYAASGIGPTLYSWDTDLLAKNFSNQTDLYSKAGWFIPDNNALGGGQTPEAVESWYYAYQATGDQYWRDVAWSYVLAQNRTMRLGSGFASIKNVLTKDGNGTGNFMASFMLAETLKYQYMIQAPKGGVYDVLYGKDKVNHFVYNTEAHPLRVRAKKPV